MNTWIVTTIAIVGCAKLLFDAVFTIGRWTKGVEHGVEQKPKVTLERLSWELEQICREIRELKTAVDGRYAELTAKVNADHITIRDLLTWRAGLLGDLTAHFYSQPIVDRIAKEGETDRQAIRKDLDALKAFVYARRDGDITG